MTYSNGIGDWKGLPPTAPAPAENRSAEVQKPTASTHPPQTDAATLSPAGNLIAQALHGSDVRTEKVERIRQSIADGTYNVSSADVAEKMIQSLLD
jgi:negative regulator of flagellin synthesis FlgM